MKITREMVGLEFSIISAIRTDSDEYKVKIKFEELSDEGLELFGLEEDDI